MPGANADLVRAIEARIQTRFLLNPAAVKHGLTARAMETLFWLAQGKTNPDIATILGIMESTVKKHMQEIFQKLRVET